MSFFSKETVTFPKILHSTLSGTVVWFCFWGFFSSQRRYLNYLSYKWAGSEITLICRQNSICEVQPFPMCACTLGIRIYPPTEILLVIFPAEISLYGSNCIKEAKSCVQLWVTLRWGGRGELQQDQPGLSWERILCQSSLAQPLELQPCCAQQGPVRNG